MSDSHTPRTSSFHAATSSCTRATHAERSGAAASVRGRDHAAQRVAHVALQPHVERVVAPQLLAVDVELHGRGALRRNPVAVGDLAAGMAADEEHQVCLAQDSVGALARVIPRHAHRQGMIGREHRLGVQRGGHRDRQLLGKRDQLGAGIRGGDTAPGHDHRPLRPGEPVQGLRDLVGVRLGAERRHPGERLLDDHFQVGFLVEHRLAGEAIQVEVRRARRAGGGGAERLAQSDRQQLRGADVGAVLGHRGERLDVVHLLVGVALLADRQLAPGQGDHRRAGQERILQPGGQVDRAHRLRHAQARAAPYPRIGVRHVRGSLLAVGLNTSHLQLLHLHQRARTDERHEEHVVDAVAVGHLGDETSASHSCHSRAQRYPKRRAL